MTKKSLVVLTVSVVSAESGLGTFRDNGGLWDKYDVNEVASIEGWYRNRQLVLDFYNERRAQLRDAAPNAAHKAIAELEESGFVVEDTYSYSDVYGEGIVVEQSKTNTADKGSTIVITVSLGSATIEVPSVIGYDQANAESTLSNAGFTVNVETRNDEATAGTVISQSPQGSINADADHTVTIVVSTGPKTSPEPINPGDNTGDSTTDEGDTSSDTDSSSEGEKSDSSTTDESSSSSSSSDSSSSSST